MRLFTSLPSIVYHRISRKYGVKILAVKHLKILLLAFKSAARFTEKYKTIELMMFTDCKSVHSEDLFLYLLVMSLYDPTLSGTRMLGPEEALTLRQVCEQHLSKHSKLYASDCWQAEKQGERMLLSEALRSAITNYRLLKITRIE
jgi:hypothetical protein